VISLTQETWEIVMKSRVIAAALLAVTVATPALAQGMDSRRSPYPASAYSGYVAPGPAFVAKHRFTSSASRYSGQHAGGPANAFVRPS
jgi:hypothetical protein